MAGIRVKKQYALGIWLPGEASRRDVVLDFPAGTLNLGGEKRLIHPDLRIFPTDRIGVTGPNGAGKSSLVRQVLPCFNLPEEQVTYVPQEIDLSRSREILGQVKNLPQDHLGQIMTLISRLGSRPDGLIQSAAPSPGETRKLLLALGMMRRPAVIVMDEPTNHLDIVSIQCLEDALADCPCALLLVSHDRRFLDRLTTAAWRLEKAGDQKETFQLTCG